MTEYKWLDDPKTVTLQIKTDDKEPDYSVMIDGKWQPCRLGASGYFELYPTKRTVIRDLREPIK